MGALSLPISQETRSALTTREAQLFSASKEVVPTLPLQHLRERRHSGTYAALCVRPCIFAIARQQQFLDGAPGCLTNRSSYPNKCLDIVSSSFLS
mmetsp:Transcript_45111/g.54219  ORF Transcript_45111/g.54219 Transcript_45111/m.54219 type:complete len:95 (+) Transcript_45111:926-1210(+)